MLNKRSVLFVVAGMLASGALAPATPAPETKEDKVKQELKKLQGKWRIVGAEVDGKEVAKEKLGDSGFEIKDGKLTVKGETTGQDLVIDPTKEPKTIDFPQVMHVRQKFRDGSVGKEEKVIQILKSVYTLEGDTLTLAIPLESRQERPTKIESGKRVGRLVCKRQKR